MRDTRAPLRVPFEPACFAYIRAMQSGFTFDESRRPLVTARLWGALSDDQFRAYLAAYDGVMDRGTQRVVLVIDARQVAPAPASQRKMQADWLVVRAPRVRELLIGMAFVISSPIVRALITAVFWWKPLPCPYTVLATMHDALDWAEQACAKEGLTVPAVGAPPRPGAGAASRESGARQRATTSALDPRHRR